MIATASLIHHTAGTGAHRAVETDVKELVGGRQDACVDTIKVHFGRRRPQRVLGSPRGGLRKYPPVEVAREQPAGRRERRGVPRADQRRRQGIPRRPAGALEGAERREQGLERDQEIHVRHRAKSGIAVVLRDERGALEGERRDPGGRQISDERASTVEERDVSGCRRPILQLGLVEQRTAHVEIAEGRVQERQETP